MPTTDDDEEQLPADHEPCGECGFDHTYEPREAKREHDAQEAKEPS